MRDPTDSKETELRRRDVLKRGAAATGAFVVGSTAVSGAAAKNNKKTGGMQAITFKFQYQPGNPFKVLNPVSELDFPASCHASESALKSYEQWFVGYQDNDDAANIVVREERAGVLADADGTDDEFVFTPNAQECEQLGQSERFTVVRAPIRPL